MSAARYVLTWRHEQEARDLVYRWGSATASPGRPGGVLGRSMAKALCGLLRLLDHGDATVRASLEAIASHAATSVRTVQRAVEVAEDAGVLEVTRFPRRAVRQPDGTVGWRAEPNRYRVRLDVLERLAAGQIGRAVRPVLRGLLTALRAKQQAITPTAPPPGLSGARSPPIQDSLEEGKRAAARAASDDWTERVPAFDFGGLVALLRGESPPKS